MICKPFHDLSISISCAVKTRKMRGKVSLVLDKTNRYAKAFFQKVKKKSVGQLMLPLSRHAQFQQSLLCLRL